MVRMSTDEENFLFDIFEPYFDYVKCELKENAPEEAKKVLQRFREIGKKYTDPSLIQQY